MRRRALSHWTGRPFLPVLLRGAAPLRGAGGTRQHCCGNALSPARREWLGRLLRGYTELVLGQVQLGSWLSTAWCAGLVVQHLLLAHASGGGSLCAWQQCTLAALAALALGLRTHASASTRWHPLAGGAGFTRG
eukprot:5047173-Alexandrium_andersonii.AAC.1